MAALAALKPSARPSQGSAARWSRSTSRSVPTTLYIVADLPDNKAAIAMAATVGATGALSNYETVVLLEPAEIDQALRQSVDYRPPGG